MTFPFDQIDIKTYNVLTKVFILSILNFLYALFKTQNVSAK